MAKTMTAPNGPPSHNHKGWWIAATTDPPRPSATASTRTRIAASTTPNPAAPTVPTRRPSAPEIEACAAPAMPAAREKTIAVRVPVTAARLSDADARRVRRAGPVPGRSPPDPQTALSSSLVRSGDQRARREAAFREPVRFRVVEAFRAAAVLRFRAVAAFFPAATRFGDFRVVLLRAVVLLRVVEAFRAAVDLRGRVVCCSVAAPSIDPPRGIAVRSDRGVG